MDPKQEAKFHRCFLPLRNNKEAGMWPPLKSLRRSNPFSIPEGSGTCDEINKNNNHHDSESASSDIQRKGWPTLPFEQEEEPFPIASPVIACQLLQFRVIKLILGGTKVDRVQFFLCFPTISQGDFRHPRILVSGSICDRDRPAVPFDRSLFANRGGVFMVYGGRKGSWISSFTRLGGTLMLLRMGYL